MLGLLVMAVANMLYTAGDANLGGWTFGARATNATYYDSVGIVRTAGNNVARDAHYLVGVRHLLIEINRTNSALWSQDLTNAAWTKTNITIGGSAIAPDGTTMTTNGIIGNAGALTPSLVNAAPYTWTTGVQQAWATFVQNGNKNQWWIRTTDKAGTTADSWFNGTTGVVGTKAGTHTVKVWTLANSNVRAELQLSTAGTGAGGQFVAIAPVDANGSTTLTGDGATVNGYVWGEQMEQDRLWVSSYIPTTAAPATRNFESMTKPHNSVPQARTLYYNGTSIVIPVAGSGWFIIGAGNDYAALGFANANSPNASVTETKSRSVFWPSSATARIDATQLGDQVEVRCAYDSACFSYGAVARNLGAEVVQKAAQGTTAYNNAYGSTTYTVSGSGTQHSIAIRRLADILDVQTMQQCRDAFVPQPAATAYTNRVWTLTPDGTHKIIPGRGRGRGH